MPAKTLRPPAYRLHKSSGQARVIVGGRHLYLGKFGTPASEEEYRQVLAEWLETGRIAEPALPATPEIAPTVNVLLLAFLRHAEKRYVKDGKATSEIRSFRTALRPVHETYGRQPVTRFGPLALTACRQQLIDAGYCRRRVNGHVRRIQRVFQWGVAREVVPVEVWQALLAVEDLKPGEAKDLPPIRTVPEEHIQAIQPFVTPPIWAMVQLQLWTACRPGEACRIRGIDIIQGDAIWEYRPRLHKTQHHGKERLILIGPHGQEVIRAWLRDPTAYLFSPREGRAWHLRQRAQQRKTPVSPSQRRRRDAPYRAHHADHYSVLTYDHAIYRACDRASVPRWAPNRLRHNAATRVRAEFGLEAARVILGHSAPSTTEVYAEIALAKAREVAQKVG